MNERDVLVALLRDLAKQIQSLDEAHLSDVLSGKARLEVVVRAVERRPQRKSGQKLSEEELTKIGDTLRSSGSREEGERVLREKLPSKSDMARLARKLDLPVQKNDSAERLRARLIESTIGFRLRSAAVQGTAKMGPDE